MWVAKIKYLTKGTLIGDCAVKHKVTLYGFPLSYSYEKEWIYVHIAGSIIGAEDDKMSFFDDLSSKDRTLNLEESRGFIIGTIKEPIFAKHLYNKDIIHVAPIVISDKGYEMFTIGSFTREAITKLIDLFKKRYSAKLISIVKKKISSISIMRAHPDLTEKQRQAIELAMKNGYYLSPRKIDIQRLAKMAKLSFSTYQVHLRKAEQKLMPYLLD